MADPNLRRPQRIIRPLTPEERARHAKIREAVEAEKPELKAEAKATVDRYEASLLRHLRIRAVFDVSPHSSPPARSRASRSRM